jgi:hypothetical protein
MAKETKDMPINMPCDDPEGCKHFKEEMRLRDLFQQISYCEDARKKCGIGYHGYIDKIAKQALTQKE